MRLLCLTIFAILVSGLTAQKTYLECGRLITATNDEVLTEQTIVVEDGMILEILSGYPRLAEGSEVIDLRDRTVMPGLIDLHVHIESQSSKTRYLERFTMDPADVALRATTYCDKTLQAGFTTVRDLGGSGVNVSLRNAISAGHIPGPRIVTAEKAIGTTGGHADPTNGQRSDLMGDPGPNEGVINGPEDAYAAVRARYKKGADCIKITATGGVLSVAKDGSGPQFTQEEANAIVAAANDYGMTTAAHAHGAEGMKRAVIAGITTIEHGTLMNKEVMDLMIENGTYYVPTISAGKFVAEKARQPGFYPAIIVPKALSIGAQIQNTFKKAYAYGVPIAFGTDTGVSYHGDNAREFEFMVEAGMPEIASIRSATEVAAKVLRLDEQIGTIKAGLRADIIAVPGNPTEDIKLMTQVNFVMKDGKVYRHDQ
ncbi:amidohydrolase [Lewinellaceae bacterium SD302]|nr:amidohydrolase [Lewinellaceae bacterium SD302]